MYYAAGSSAQFIPHIRTPTLFLVSSDDPFLGTLPVAECTANPATASEKEKALKPLAAATVQVIEDEENPGYYMGKFFLKPHFQMEGMDIGMSLVSKLPGG